MFNLVTTGPRDCRSSPTFTEVFFHLHLVFARELQVIEGGATGSDQWVREACESLAIQHEREDADWVGPCDLGGMCRPGHRRPRRGGGTYCPEAGVRRNQHMLDRYDPPMVVALLDRPLASTKGTKDMMTRATAEGRCTVEIDVRRSIDECINALSSSLVDVI